MLHHFRPTQVTKITRTCSSIGTEDGPVHPYEESARLNTTRRPYMETTRGNPLRDICICLRVQGESDQMTDDEEQKKRSPIQSLIIEVLQSPDTDKLRAGNISKERRQGVPRDVSRTKQP